jgi:starch phosphorylase
VAQRFYSRDADGIPTQWVAMVRHTLKSLGPKVLATRMVRDYAVQLYAPAAASSAQMQADDYAAARELSAWKSWVVGCWKEVAVRHVESNVEGDPTLGGSLQLRAEVALSGLKAKDVEVQAVYGPVDADNRLTRPATLPLSFAEERDHTGFFVGSIPLSKAGAFGYTVRVLPKHPLLANLAETGLVATAS